MQWSRSQHRTIHIGNLTFIVGNILETEIFKADRKFHLASPCPIKAWEFGLSKKEDDSVFLYSQTYKIFSYESNINIWV